MALSEAHRSALYQSFAPVVGDDEAVHAMLSHFPTHPGDEPASRDFVRSECDLVRSDLRAEIAELRTEMHTEFGKIHAELANVRTEMHTALGTVGVEFGNIRGEMHGLRGEMHRSARVQLQWIAMLNISLGMLLIAFISELAK